MAKLTDEQKIENKAAKRILDVAFRARRNEYTEAMDAALRDFEASSPLGAQKDVANDAFEKGLEARRLEQIEIGRQILELQDKIKGLLVKHEIDKLNQCRRETSDAYFIGKRVVSEEVDAKYPDIAGVRYAEAWDNNVNSKN